MIKWRKSSDVDAKTVTGSWMTYSVLGVVIITMAFFGVCDPSQGGLVLPSGTAAKIDGEKISAIEFRRAYLNYSNQLQQQYRDKYDAVALGVAGQVMNGLVERTAQYKEAVKNGISASDAEVDNIIIEGKYFANEQGNFDKTLFERYLKSQGHNEATFTEELRRNIITTKFRNLVTSTYRGSEKVAELNYLLDESKVDVEYLRLDPQSFPITIVAADVDAYLASPEGQKSVKDYFEGNKAEFNKEARVKARHILIAHKGARNASGAAAERSEAAAKEMADKVLAEVKQAGADFAALAAKYTDEAAGKSKGGDLGFFKKEQMVKEFSDAAFGMKAGEIGGPVKSPFGFHIIRVDTVEEAKNVAFEDAQRGIAEKLLQKERRPKIIAEKTKTLITDLKAGKDDSAALGLSWKATGPFSVGARFVPGLGADKAALAAIASLKTPGQLAPEPVEVAGVTYILRLKSKTEADLSKLTAEKKKELSEQGKYMESYTLFNAFSEDIKKRYEKDKKIYKNPEFLAYDQKLQGDAPAGENAQ